jgi:hypothetical protein
MRTGSSVLLVLAALTASAAARPPSPPATPMPAQHDFEVDRAASRIDLPSQDAFLYRHEHGDDSDTLMLGNPRTHPAPVGASGPSITIGSFHAEFGGTGDRVHLAHYTLVGVRVMGGTVSGTIDGRSARVAIHW